MELLELMKSRHSVRQYLDKEIEVEKRKKLQELLEKVNKESGLSMQIFFDEPECFNSTLAHYGKFTNVKNYIAIVGKKSEQEKAGYYGEKVVLECQDLGLNTCWVALTHGKTKAVISNGQKLLIVISLGYGENCGVPHRSKSIDVLSKASKDEEFFNLGMEAVSLAPTAVNQQIFLFELHDDSAVTAKSLGGFYSMIDLGIARYHFEAIAKHKVEIVHK